MVKVAVGVAAAVERDGGVLPLHAARGGQVHHLPRKDAHAIAIFEEGAVAQKSDLLWVVGGWGSGRTG